MRAKLVSFGGGGFEVYAKVHSYSQSPRNYLRLPASMCVARARRSREDQESEDIRRAMQRAKQSVRHRCKHMGASHLLTLTTREAGPLYRSFDEWVALWDGLKRRIERIAGQRFPYVCVVERHPSNPEHLHLHVALASRVNVSTIRRLWYITLGGSGDERGAAAPGGVDIRAIRSPNKLRRTATIARYISKYITKDSAAEFNRKRYFASSLSAPEVRSWWLKSINIGDALVELIGTLGIDALQMRSDVYLPRDGDFVWMQHVPGASATGPPPW